MSLAGSYGGWELVYGLQVLRTCHTVSQRGQDSDFSSPILVPFAPHHRSSRSRTRQSPMGGVSGKVGDYGSSRKHQKGATKGRMSGTKDFSCRTGLGGHTALPRSYFSYPGRMVKPPSWETGAAPDPAQVTFHRQSSQFQ